MANATFTNLPEEKRRRFLEVAIAEFAEHPYQSASVSRIVERLGIAKGSVYQYFAHKQDLFLSLLEHAAAEQLRILGGLAPPDPRPGFFALLRWQMSASVQVAAAAPQLVRLMHRAFAEDLPFRAEAERRVGAAGADHFVQLLRMGVETGELAPDLDLELTASMIQAMLADLPKLIARRLGMTMAEAAANAERLTGPEVEAIYDAVVRVLRDGLRRRA